MGGTKASEILYSESRVPIAFVFSILAIITNLLQFLSILFANTLRAKLPLFQYLLGWSCRHCFHFLNSCFHVASIALGAVITGQH
jgi:hypothetical protein